MYLLCFRGFLKRAGLR
uniref:Uncharacterized protein n=1 Tax=Anguilla anguilla TaxID=7936 RepID=A0A0E9SE92_ANGAN